jgi:hypothetical protein
MMHGREKSGSAIVAVKPTNKAVPTAAEPVEPRAGAKGNARQRSTHRTQGRERVAQALERVRQAARQRPRTESILLLCEAHLVAHAAAARPEGSLLMATNARLAADWLPQPRILHPYPDKRFAVVHPRWEPCAGIPPARIWAGGGQQ